MTALLDFLEDKFSFHELEEVKKAEKELNHIYGVELSPLKALRVREVFLSLLTNIFHRFYPDDRADYELKKGIRH